MDDRPGPVAAGRGCGGGAWRAAAASCSTPVPRSRSTEALWCDEVAAVSPPGSSGSATADAWFFGEMSPLAPLRTPQLPCTAWLAGGGTATTSSLERHARGAGLAPVTPGGTSAPRWTGPGGAPPPFSAAQAPLGKRAAAWAPPAAKRLPAPGSDGAMGPSTPDLAADAFLAAAQVSPWDFFTLLPAALVPNPGWALATAPLREAHEAALHAAVICDRVVRSGASLPHHPAIVFVATLRLARKAAAGGLPRPSNDVAVWAALASYIRVLVSGEGPAPPPGGSAAGRLGAVDPRELAAAEWAILASIDYRVHVRVPAAVAAAPPRAALPTAALPDAAQAIAACVAATGRSSRRPAWAAGGAAGRDAAATGHAADGPRPTVDCRPPAALGYALAHILCAPAAG